MQREAPGTEGHARVIEEARGDGEWLELEVELAGVSGGPEMIPSSLVALEA